MCLVSYLSFFSLSALFLSNTHDNGPVYTVHSFARLLLLYIVNTRQIKAIAIDR